MSKMMYLRAALDETIRRWVCAFVAMASVSLVLPQPAQSQPPATESLSTKLSEAQQLHEQSVKLREAGQYREAQQLAERALVLWEQALGPEHPEVAKSLNNLALLYSYRGDYREAERLHTRALAIREQALGPDHSDVGASLYNLANLYSDRGEYAAAESLYRRALAIREKALGPEHVYVGGILDSLALVYYRRGDYAGAEPLYQRALAIVQKALGPEHPYVAIVLNNLANLYDDREDNAEAERLHRRALAIREKALGPEHPYVASGLNNLALLYQERGDSDGAEKLYLRSLTIKEKVLGLDHPDVANTLNNLATLYSDRGEYDRAESLLKRSLAIREKVFGAVHPQISTGLFTLSLLRLRQDRPLEARTLLQQALDIQEQHLSLNLPAASQQRNLAFLSSLKDSTDLALWLHLQTKDPQTRDPAAGRLALSAILSRKGRVLEEASLALERLRHRLPKERQPLLQQLAEARTQLAGFVYKETLTPSNGDYQERLTTLRSRIYQLEDALADAGVGLRAITQPLTLKAVQEALPRDAVLVEFALYRPINVKATTPAARFGSPRYAAYLLAPEGSPIGIDLGEARPIDALIRYWRVWLLDPTSPPKGRVHTVAHQLYQKLLAPLESNLGNKHLLLAPDGQLNTVPFAALVGSDGRGLLHRHTLTYLVSGRELPRLAQPALVPQSPPLVIGGPDFNRAAPDPSPATLASATGSPAEDNPRLNRTQENLRSAALELFTARPLPGTKQEAEAIARLLARPDTRLLTGALATENALKAARSPVLVHLATHGFFLDDAQAGADLQEPLLRSGVSLAGFNRRASGGEDGVLTALEAQSLDLEGTELAVLSACLGGAGPVLGGEGVQGLRRALVLAGTRSQVMALWTVEDQTTVGLMERFYRGLIAGLGRSEALRQAQLAVSLQPGRSHPYWWASFTASGNWRPVRFSKHRR